MAFVSDLATAVRFHRKKAKLTRVALAKLTGVGKTAVFDLEHAKPTVQLDTVLKVLSALNITLKLSSPLIDAQSSKS